MPLDPLKAKPSLNGGLPWWTDTEIQLAAEDALREIGMAELFCEAVAAVDGRTIQVIGVIGDGLVLRPASDSELDAIDPTRAETGPAKRYVAGTGSVSYWPAAPAAAQVIQSRVPVATSGVPEVGFVLARWLAIADLRSRETDGAMPEVAAAVREFVGRIMKGIAP